MDLLNVVIFLALIATISVMVLGLFALGQGRELEERHGTHLMFARVGLQAFAILLLIFAVYLRY